MSSAKYTRGGVPFGELAGPYGAQIVRVGGYVDGEFVVDSRRTRMSRVAVLQSQIASMQRELAELEQFPGDNFALGTAVLFTKMFEDSPAREFHYAAVKGSATQWHLTGVIVDPQSDTSRRVNRVDWERLCYFMRDAVNVRVVFAEDGHPLIARAAAPLVPDVEDPEPPVRTPVRDPNRA